MLLLPGRRLWQLDNKKVCVFKPFIIDAVVFDYPGRAFKGYLQSAATHLAHFGISGESQVACPNSHAHLGHVAASIISLRIVILCSRPVHLAHWRGSPSYGCATIIHRRSKGLRAIILRLVAPFLGR